MYLARRGRSTIENKTNPIASSLLNFLRATVREILINRMTTPHPRYECANLTTNQDFEQLQAQPFHRKRRKAFQIVSACNFLTTPLLRFSHDADDGRERAIQSKSAVTCPQREPYFEYFKTSGNQLTDAWTPKKKTNNQRKEKILTDSRLLFVRFLSIKAKTTCKKTDIKNVEITERKQKKHKSQWLKLTTSEKARARENERQ